MRLTRTRIRLGVSIKLASVDRNIDNIGVKHGDTLAPSLELSVLKFQAVVETLMPKLTGRARGIREPTAAGRFLTEVHHSDSEGQIAHQQGVSDSVVV